MRFAGPKFDLQEIRTAADRAAKLTSQLLAFSRRQVLQPAVLDMNKVVQDIARMLQRLIGEDIEIVFDLDPGLEHVWADRGRLEQVIMNLAVNARDAMPDGGKLMLCTACGRPLGFSSCRDTPTFRKAICRRRPAGS